MYTLKKDLEIYKNIYKYHYKLLDILIRYSLSLIQKNIKDDNDIKYVNNLIIEIKKIFLLLNTLNINNENHFKDLFKENEKYILINNDEYSKKIKEYYDILAKLSIK